MDDVTDADTVHGRAARGDRSLLVLRGKPDRPRGVEPPASGPVGMGVRVGRQHRRGGRPRLGGDRCPIRPVVGRPDAIERIRPHLAGSNDGLADEPAQETQIGHDAQHDRLVEGDLEAVECGGPVRAPGDDLGEHRVEPSADLRADRDPGIDPDALAGRPTQ